MATYLHLEEVDLKSGARSKLGQAELLKKSAAEKERRRHGTLPVEGEGRHHILGEGRADLLEEALVQIGLPPFAIAGAAIEGVERAPVHIAQRLPFEGRPSPTKLVESAGDEG